MLRRFVLSLSHRADVVPRQQARFASVEAKISIHTNRFPALSGEASQPPLLVVHGLLGSSSNFRTIAGMPELNQNADVITLDLRNHGRSGHSSEASLQSMAADILSVADTAVRGHKTPKVNLLGHSLGGKVAMALALQQPERVSRLVVADISTVRYDQAAVAWQQVSAIVRAVARTEPSHLSHRRDGDAMLESAGVPAGYRGFILQNLIPDKSRGGFQWRCNLQALLEHLPQYAQFPYEPIEDSSRLPPTTFIRGGLSDYVNVALHGDAIERFFPGAVIHTIDGAGHFVHAEKPREFVDAVAEALQR